MNHPPPSSSFPQASFPPEPLRAVACPTCFGAIAVGTDLLGQAAECPLCGRGFQVPHAAVAAPPQQSPASSPVPMAPAEAPPAQAAPSNGQPSDLASGPANDLAFQEPVRTITSGGQVVTLRRLTPEEKAVRRGRRNLIMMLTGVSILMAIVLLLGTKRAPRRP